MKTIPKFRTEFDPTIHSYRVYGEDPDEYIAIAHVHQYFDVGIVFGMHGKALLRSLLNDLFRGNLKEAGIRSLQGYVLPTVAAAIKAVTRGEPCKVIINRNYTNASGREVVWINVEVI